MIREYYEDGQLKSEKTTKASIEDAVVNQKDSIIEFQDVMNYYISKDQELILGDLKNKNYIFEKEQNSKSPIFDTQINCLKLANNDDILTMTGIVIFKTSSKITAISYFTFNSIDFKNKQNEIYKGGFKQTITDPTSHWVFEKKDTVVAVEKKIIKVSDKEITRYEFTISHFN